MQTFLIIILLPFENKIKLWLIILKNKNSQFDLLIRKWLRLVKIKRHALGAHLPY